MATKEKEAPEGSVDPKDLDKLPEADPKERGLSGTGIPTELANAPSAVPLYMVMVDTFGAKVQHSKGEILKPDDSPYDLELAAERGVVKRLTAAEARVALLSPSFNLALTPDGKAVDQDLLVSGRFHAGLPDPNDPHFGPNGERATVTGPQGPKAPEPDEEARNPVITADEGTSHDTALADHFRQAREAAQKG